MPACGVAGLSQVKMYRARYRIAAQHCLQTPTTDSKDCYKVSCISSTALSTVKAKGKRRQLLANTAFARLYCFMQIQLLCMPENLPAH
jgi:hypothetical protein